MKLSIRKFSWLTMVPQMERENAFDLKPDLKRRPRLQDKSLEKEFWSRWDKQEGYDVFQRRGYRRLLQCFISSAHPREGQSVLEVGCGSGAFTGYLCDLGLRVFGLDLSERLLHIGRSRTQGRLFSTGDLEQLPFKEDCFDIVVASAVLHHVPQMDKAVGEIFRVLKPGGFFFAFDPNKRHPIMWLYRDRRSPLHSAIGYSPNERLLKSEELSEQLGDFFEGVRVNGMSGITFKWLADKRVRLLLPLYNFFEIVFCALPVSKKYGAFLISSARKRETAE